MKKINAAAALVTTLMIPAMSWAAGGDYQSYVNTYPASQSSTQHVNTAE